MKTQRDGVAGSFQCAVVLYMQRAVFVFGGKYVLEVSGRVNSTLAVFAVETVLFRLFVKVDCFSVHFHSEVFGWKVPACSQESAVKSRCKFNI